MRYFTILIVILKRWIYFSYVFLKGLNNNTKMLQKRTNVAEFHIVLSYGTYTDELMKPLKCIIF